VHQNTAILPFKPASNLAISIIPSNTYSELQHPKATARKEPLVTSGFEYRKSNEWHGRLLISNKAE